MVLPESMWAEIPMLRYVAKIFHDPDTLRRRPKGGTPFVRATNHTSTTVGRVQINPPFQRRADGHAGRELGRHTKTDLRSILINFGVEHGKSPGQI